jgi:hypothetical protein
MPLVCPMLEQMMVRVPRVRGFPAKNVLATSLLSTLISASLSSALFEAVSLLVSSISFRYLRPLVAIWSLSHPVRHLKTRLTIFPNTDHIQVRQDWHVMICVNKAFLGCLVEPNVILLVEGTQCWRT